MTQDLSPVNDRDFDHTVETAEVPILVEFWKPGCGHCRALAAELKALQQQTGSKLLVFAMNVEENYQIPAELEITTLPALALFYRGEFRRFIGGVGKRQDIMRQLIEEGMSFLAG